VTCIYVGWDGDEIVAGHLADHVKLRNIRRDPRVTLSVESEIQFEGFSPYLVIQGIARVEEGGAVPLLCRITGSQFPPPGDNWPEGFVTRISPRNSQAPDPGVLPTEIDDGDLRFPSGIYAVTWRGLAMVSCRGGR
jgi:hypothetical protein